MGISNFIGSAEKKIAQLRGELEQKRIEVSQIELGIARLPDLHREIAFLDEQIAAGIKFVAPDNPNWQPEKIKPVIPRKWDNPFKSGEIGLTALGVLRRDGGWLRPYDVAKIMLTDIEFDLEDRAMQQKITNTVAAYFKKHKGDLVESTTDYAKKWRVIREFGESDKN